MSLNGLAQSSGVYKPVPRHSVSRHAVQFYEKDEFLAQAVGRFAIEGLRAGEGVLLIATPDHAAWIQKELWPKMDMARTQRQGQLVFMDAQETLDSFLEGGLPQAQLFLHRFGSLLEQMSATYSGVRAYGEMVNLLWKEGNLEGTLALENLWNELAQRHTFSLLCGYAMENFSQEIDGVAFADVCGCHTHVHPAEDFSGDSKEDEHLRYIAELQQRSQALKTEIVQRRAIERELLLSREELRAARDAAEAASESKSRFLANMSHEIRSPLSAILGFAELMKDPYLSSGRRCEYAEIVTRNGRQLSALINDLLDISKVEAGKLATERLPVSLSSLIEDVMKLFQQNALGKGLSLELAPCHFPDQICSDPTRLRQILTNLVGNAVKFTTKGGVKVYLDPPAGTDQWIGVRIEDTGIGVMSDQHENIFHPFAQADASMTRKYGGTGLGLALSRKLAKALGGDLVLLRSDVGKGSSFLLSIPANFELLPQQPVLSHNKKRDGSHAKPLEHSLVGRRILLAEDSLDNQLLIRCYLEAEGIAVEVAQNGFEAVEMALREDFSLVLMDVMMPQCDGYEATRRLRQMGYRKPIVALTAHALQEERERSFSEGCSDHLSKPVRRQDLLATVGRLLAELSPAASISQLSAV